MLGLYEGKSAKVVRVRHLKLGDEVSRFSGKTGIVVDDSKFFTTVIVGESVPSGLGDRVWHFMPEELEVVGHMRIKKTKTAQERMNFRNKYQEFKVLKKEHEYGK